MFRIIKRSPWIALGAAGAWFLDPVQGPQRRAMVTTKARRWKDDMMSARTPTVDEPFGGTPATRLPSELADTTLGSAFGMSDRASLRRDATAAWRFETRTAAPVGGGSSPTPVGPSIWCARQSRRWKSGTSVVVVGAVVGEDERLQRGVTVLPGLRSTPEDRAQDRRDRPPRTRRRSRRPERGDGSAGTRRGAGTARTRRRPRSIATAGRDGRTRSRRTRPARSGIATGSSSIPSISASASIAKRFVSQHHCRLVM